jgi:hypothetical protein
LKLSAPCKPGDFWVKETKPQYKDRAAGGGREMQKFTNSYTFGLTMRKMKRPRKKFFAAVLRWLVSLMGKRRGYAPFLRPKRRTNGNEGKKDN